MDYYNKYLKYKLKYNELKKNGLKKLIGGDKPFINFIDRINLFINSDMEKYLNPIYGYYMCENGYISNNYFLVKKKLIDTKHSDTIKRICKLIPGAIQPTNDIMKLKPIDFGRYIAIKYVNMQNKIEGNNIINSINDSGKIIFHNKLNKADTLKLNEYISKLRRFIPINTDNEELYFHFILYCLWWNSNNDDGIVEYYKGINEILEIINVYLEDNDRYKYDMIYTNPSMQNNHNFEKTIFNILSKPFKIYNQEYSRIFCESIKNTYADCGETTARNLINLICLNKNKFDINILRDNFKNINPRVLEYYEKFNTFDSQSLMNTELNARDLWSDLITNDASHNIIFLKKCDDLDKKYEMNSGLSKDGITGNFLQLIRNLLGIENFEEIKNDTIENIIDNTKNGIGDINIYHKNMGKIIIHCTEGHYYMELQKKDNYDIKKDFSKENIKKIDILLKKNIKQDDLIWIDFSSELLVEYINSYEDNIDLFKLSLTDKYDDDTRRRIIINTEKNIFRYIESNFLNDDILNKYNFKSVNYDFVKKIPNLKRLECDIIDKNIKQIDLSPLVNIESIGNNFMYRFHNLEKIDLSPLVNLKTIGYNFLFECYEIKDINLSHLIHLKKIDGSFMTLCIKLEKINLSGLDNLEEIGLDFMIGCSKLKEIDLSSLKKIKNIYNRFMAECSEIRKIDLTPLKNLEEINNSFMENCNKLEKIDLNGLVNLKSIGNSFMYRCKNLIHIDFSSLVNLKTIDSNFMSGCLKLENINLTNLDNLESIGNYFMKDCNMLREINLISLRKLKKINTGFMNVCGLKKLDLSPLENIESIDDKFLYNCCALKEINLNSLRKLRKIGESFMGNCSDLREINLNSLENVETIGQRFMESCVSLEQIDLSPLVNLQSVGERFLYKCRNLKKIILNNNVRLNETLQSSILSNILSNINPPEIIYK
jgi:hypothetical protein